MFDVAMGCCVGAEVCEFVRLNILHYLSTAYLDGLAVFKNRRARIDDKTSLLRSSLRPWLKITAHSN